MLHAGHVEIVAIVMPLIFGQSLLILCGYFHKYFRDSRAFKALLCSLIIIRVLSSTFFRDSVIINVFVFVKILVFSLVTLYIKNTFPGEVCGSC